MRDNNAVRIRSLRTVSILDTWYELDMLTLYDLAEGLQSVSVKEAKRQWYASMQAIQGDKAVAGCHGCH